MVIVGSSPFASMSRLAVNIPARTSVIWPTFVFVYVVIAIGPLAGCAVSLTRSAACKPNTRRGTGFNLSVMPDCITYNGKPDSEFKGLRDWQPVDGGRVPARHGNLPYWRGAGRWHCYGGIAFGRVAGGGV